MNLIRTRVNTDSREESPIESALATLRAHVGDEHTAASVFDEVLHLIQPYHRSTFWGDRMLILDRAASFRDDPKFKRAVSTAHSSTGANQYTSPDGIGWRLNTLIWAAHQALRVTGDFVECGVYEGDMSWVLTEIIDFARANRSLHLFDTFSGFSSEYSSADDFPDCPQFFEFLNTEYKRPAIFDYVRDRFETKPYVHIHRGTVPDSLVDAPAIISLLHLDMNSPGPERAALEVLYERVSTGGIIVFDDYGWTIHRKQKKAADEFMSAKGHRILELPTGQGLAVKTAQQKNGGALGVLKRLRLRVTGRPGHGNRS